MPHEARKFNQVRKAQGLPPLPDSAGHEEEVERVEPPPSTPTPTPPPPQAPQRQPDPEEEQGKAVIKEAVVESQEKGFSLGALGGAVLGKGLKAVGKEGLAGQVGDKFAWFKRNVEQPLGAMIANTAEGRALMGGVGAVGALFRDDKSALEELKRGQQTPGLPNDVRKLLERKLQIPEMLRGQDGEDAIVPFTEGWREKYEARYTPEQRAAAESVPWLAVPGGGQARKLFAAKSLASKGLPKVGFKLAEFAVRPLAAAEDIAGRAIKAPFQGAAAAVRLAGKPFGLLRPKTLEFIAKDALPAFGQLGARKQGVADKIIMTTERLKAAKGAGQEGKVQTLRDQLKGLKSQQQVIRKKIEASGPGNLPLSSANKNEITMAVARGDTRQAALSVVRERTKASRALVPVEGEVGVFHVANTADNRSVLRALEKGQSPQRFKELPLNSSAARLNLARKQMGVRLSEEAVLQRTPKQVLEEVSQVPRTILTIWDVSAPLRQGVMLAPGHPIRFGKSLWSMGKATFSEKYMLEHFAERQKHAMFKTYVDEAKLSYTFTGPGGVSIQAGEEAFRQTLTRALPGFKWSERAYVTFLNDLRFGVMDDVVRGWKKGSGIPGFGRKGSQVSAYWKKKGGQSLLNKMEEEGRVITDKDLKELALFINRATGRGGLGPLEGSATIMNALFFSPRLLAGRLLTPQSLITGTSRVRRTAAKDLVAFFATGIGILGLVKASGGADVETDWRSTDFGKMRIGNTRIDFWGGMQPIARVIGQMTSGERKSDLGDITGIDRTQVMISFGRGKMAPIPSELTDLYFGEDLIGEDVDITTREGIEQQLWDNFVPLFTQDLVEAIKEEGIMGGMIASVGGVGMNVQTYKTKTVRSRELYGLGDDERPEKYMFDVVDLLFPFGSDDIKERREDDMLSLNGVLELSITEGALNDKRVRGFVSQYFDIESRMSFAYDELFGDLDEPQWGTGRNTKFMKAYDGWLAIFAEDSPARVEGVMLADVQEEMMLLAEASWDEETAEFMSRNTNRNPVPETVMLLLQSRVKKTWERIHRSQLAREAHMRESGLEEDVIKLFHDQFFVYNTEEN